jgi:hypothetical protein
MDTSHVGGRRRFERPFLAISTAALLLASAALAPVAAAQHDPGSDTGIDILDSSEGTFTFAATSAESLLNGSFDAAGDDDLLTGHPGAVRLDPTNSDAITFDAIDACPDGGGIDIVGRNLPGDFSINVVDTRTGANTMYERTGGTGGIDFIHPGALPCSPGDGSDPPDRIVGDTRGELVAGNPRQCISSVRFRTVLDSSGRETDVLDRIFGGGTGRDSLDFVDGDRASGTAVYQARTPGYSVIVIVQPNSQGLLIEGKPKTFRRANARSMLRRILDGEGRQAFLNDVTKPARACAWEMTTNMRQDAQTVEDYVDGVISRRSGAIVAPVDRARFSGDLVPSGVSLEFTFDDTSPPTPVNPIRLDDGGVFWFTSPDEFGVFTRVLDGCSINGQHWVLASVPDQFALDVTLTDTLSGTTNTWTDPGVPVDDRTGITFVDRLGIDCLTP